jgi:hypothetical protein
MKLFKFGKQVPIDDAPKKIIEALHKDLSRITLTAWRKMYDDVYQAANTTNRTWLEIEKAKIISEYHITKIAMMDLMGEDELNQEARKGVFSGGGGGSGILNTGIQSQAQAQAAQMNAHQQAMQSGLLGQGAYGGGGIGLLGTIK